MTSASDAFPTPSGLSGTTRSAELFAEARELIPGGVNSPVRAFNSVGGTPRFIREARGSRMTDVDGNSYIDLVCSWGPMIHGHAHPEIVDAVQQAASRGLSFGTPTAGEVDLATSLGNRRARAYLLHPGNSVVYIDTQAPHPILKLTQRLLDGHLDALLVSIASEATLEGFGDVGRQQESGPKAGRRRRGRRRQKRRGRT